MRTRKAGKTEAAGEALRRVGGVRKPKGKKGGAVVSRKLTLRSRTAGGSRGASEPEQPEQQHDEHLVDLTVVSDTEEEEEELRQQQRDEHGDGQRQQQQQAGTSQRRRQQPPSSRKRRGVAAADRVAEESIESLYTEALQEIFLALSRHEQQSYCRCARHA
jgi:hypothetical protein